MKRGIIAIILTVLMALPITASAQELCNGNISIDVPDGWDCKVHDCLAEVETSSLKLSYVKGLSMSKGDQSIVMYCISDYDEECLDPDPTDVVSDACEWGEMITQNKYTLKADDGTLLVRCDLIIDDYVDPIYLYEENTENGMIVFVAGSLEAYEGTSEKELAEIEKCIRSFLDMGYSDHIYKRYEPKKATILFTNFYNSGWFTAILIIIGIFVFFKVGLSMTKGNSEKKEENNEVFIDDPLKRRSGKKKKIENGVFDGSLEDFYESGYISYDEYLELVKKYRKE